MADPAFNWDTEASPISAPTPAAPTSPPNPTQSPAPSGPTLSAFDWNTEATPLSAPSGAANQNTTSTPFDWGKEATPLPGHQSFPQAVVSAAKDTGNSLAALPGDIGTAVAAPFEGAYKAYHDVAPLVSSAAGNLTNNMVGDKNAIQDYKPLPPNPQGLDQPIDWASAPTIPGIQKAGYQAGVLAPTILATSVGSKYGGLTGGAVGGATANAIQNYMPILYDEEQKTPNDPSGAQARAVAKAAETGAFTAAQIAAFGVPGLGARTLATGGIGAVQQVTNNLQNGRPALEGVGHATADSALSGLVLQAAHEFGSGIWNARAQPLEGQVLPPEEAPPAAPGLPPPGPPTLEGEFSEVNRTAATQQQPGQAGTQSPDGSWLFGQTGAPAPRAEAFEPVFDVETQQYHVVGPDGDQVSNHFKTPEEASIEAARLNSLNAGQSTPSGRSVLEQELQNESIQQQSSNVPANSQPVGAPPVEPAASLTIQQPVNPGSQQNTQPSPTLTAQPLIQASPNSTPVGLHQEIPYAEVPNGLGNAITSTGQSIPVQYAVVDASNLVTSHDDNLRENPNYPQDIQPRDRSRNSTELQINKILNPIRPELLAGTADAGNGAPIIGNDGVVESGNGRTMAIRRAYERNLPAAQEYRDFLEKQGYPIDGIKQPVLVRINQQPMTLPQRAAFARDANRPAQLSLSATERAMADANALQNHTFELAQSPDLMSADNRLFVRQVLNQISSPEEQGSLITPEGTLSQEGLRRVQGAMIAKAFGDPTIIQNLMESTDGNYKAIGAALIEAAPRWAMMRAEAATGQIPADLDITPHLIEAVALISRSRSEGIPLPMMVNQGDMFKSALDQVTLDILKWFAGDSFTKRIGQAKISIAVKDYAERAMKVMPGPTLFGDEPIKPTQLTELARAKSQSEPDDLFNRQQVAQPAGAEDIRPSNPKSGNDDGRLANGGAGSETYRDVSTRSTAGREQRQPQRAEPIRSGTDLKDLIARPESQVAKKQVIEYGNKTGHELVVLLNASDLAVAHIGTSEDAEFVLFPQKFVTDKENPVIAHHNHPSGHPLSDMDLAALKSSAVSVVAAYNSKGEVSVASLTPKSINGASITKEKIKSLYSVADKSIDKMLQPDIDNGKLNNRDANKLHQDIVIQALANNGIIYYHSTFQRSLISPEILKSTQAAADLAVRKSLRGGNNERSRILPDRQSGGIQPTQGVGGTPEKSGVDSEQGKPLGGNELNSNGERENRYQESGSAPTFYSALTREIEGINQPKAPARQWEGIIENLKGKGVKQDEIDWSGVKDWLRDHQGVVTKDALLDYVRAHETQIKEIVRGEKVGLTPKEKDEMVNLGLRGSLSKKQLDRYNELNTKELGLPTKHGGPNTVMPGGKNYREMTLALPKNETSGEMHTRLQMLSQELHKKYGDGWRLKASPEDLEKDEQLRNQILEAERNPPKNFYEPHHFEDPNIVAHTRFNERTGPNGEKILHVEEVQSDWHQRGRKKGYVEPKMEPETRLAYQKLRGQWEDRRWALRDQWVKDHPEDTEGFRTGPAEAAFNRFADADPALKSLRDVTDDAYKKWIATTDGVPDAPFKTTWPELAMKRMIRYAAENGYDKLTWTPGDIQNERYDLSRHINQLEYTKNENGTYALEGDMVNGGQHKFGSIPEAELDSHVGKDIAQRIINGEGGTKSDGTKFLKGVGLQVGGEGMKGFYDKILPATVNKLAKKFGSQVGKTKLGDDRPSYDDIQKQLEDFDKYPSGSPERAALRAQQENAPDYGHDSTNAEVHSLDITPAMRDSVMKGQALFDKTSEPYQKPQKEWPLQKPLENIEKAIGEKLKGTPIERFAEGYIKLFAPDEISAKSARADAFLAQNKVRVQNARGQIAKQTQKNIDFWDRKTPAEQRGWIKAHETGEYPKDDEYHQYYKAMTDATWNAEHEATGTDPNENYRDNYFSHLFENPEEAAKFFEAKVTKYGKDWFRKQRFFELAEQAEAAGHKLRTTNPEEMLMHRLMAGQTMIQTENMLRQFEASGLAAKISEYTPKGTPKAEKPTESELPGFTTERISNKANLPASMINDLRANGFRVKGPDGKTWLIHGDIKPLWQNAMEQRGLWENKKFAGDVYRGWQSLRNTWIPIKLGLSLFHPMHVATIHLATGFAAAIENTIHGGTLKDTTNSMMKGLSMGFGLKGINPVRKLVKGGQIDHPLIQAVKTPIEKRTPEQQSIVSRMEEGGFSPLQSEQDKIQARRNFMQGMNKMIADARGGKSPAAAARATQMAFGAAQSVIRGVSSPFFEHWIPAIKAQAYMLRTQNALNRDQSLLTDAGNRAETFRKISQDLDRTYGEMNYDTLFWNKTVRDAFQASFLSSGWKLAQLYYYRGLTTAPKVLYDAIKNGKFDPKQASYNMIFSLIYGGLSLMVGAMITKLLTGEDPEDITDMVFPRTGEKQPDGTPVRLRLPFFNTEASSLKYHIDTEGLLGGSISFIGDQMLETGFWKGALGQDSFGRPLMSDPTNLHQLAHTAWNTFDPISFSQYENATLKKSEVAKLATLFGAGIAPLYADKDTFENKVVAEYFKEKPGTSSAYQRDLQNDYRLATLNNQPDKAAKIAGELRETGLTNQQIGYLKQSYRTPFIDYAWQGNPNGGYKGITAEQQIQIFKTATPEEKAHFFPMMKPEAKNQVDYKPPANTDYWAAPGTPK